jgi:hypothetical protein
MKGEDMADATLERLKLLYDYEKFHIGLYGTMITGFIAILSFGSKQINIGLVLALALAIILLLVAAICGAILASSIIDVYGNYKYWDSTTKYETSLNSFWIKRIGPYETNWWKARTWWRIGHTAFWIAVFVVVGTFLGYVAYWIATGQVPE